MTYEPKWKLNNNGDAAQTIRDDYMELHRAALALSDALHKVSVNSLHGRNYQTLAFADQCREADVAHLGDLVEQVRHIEAHAVSGAARIIRQREDL